MALYTFYPCKPDGGADSFMSCELTDDHQAWLHALRILDQHRSATHVDVWEGERKVHTRARSSALT